jgi:hypothetical protein
VSASDLALRAVHISASNGQRHVVDSYVGWPVDMVARKLVKKTVLVGRDALDNRSMLDLPPAAERGVMKEGLGKRSKKRCKKSPSSDRCRRHQTEGQR